MFPLLVRAGAVILGTCLLTGCEVVALSVDAGSGIIVVRLEDDSGGRRGPYRMRVRQAGRPDRIVLAAADAPVELAVPADGPVELTLFVPAGCVTRGPNPLTVRPAADGAVSSRFAVACGH